MCVGYPAHRNNPADAAKVILIYFLWLGGLL
jgi:hypothetical protein